MSPDQRRIGERRVFRSRLSVVSGRPDMTPMVDVVFLLLIFFMLSSSFVQVSGITVNLPGAVVSSQTSVNKLVLSIDRNNTLYFNDTPMTWDILAEQLQKCKQQWNADTVIIRADRKTTYGVVVEIMSLARSLGLNVYVATMDAQGKEEIDYGSDR
ncbi:MAG: biopolymer transporter ExbD [Victivallales bacterium]|nr:biopolymer transporter ExbD [Victivallales bacterium]